MIEGETINAQTKEELYKLIVQANEVQSSELKKDILTTIKSISGRIEEANEEIRQLKNRCTNLERRQRKNNIIIFGLKVNKATLLQDTLDKLNELLGITITENDINNIYTVGGRDKVNIIVQFISYLKKISIFNNVSKLKGTGITIANDLPPEDREEHKILRSHLQKARQEQLHAKIRGNHLIIENEIYTVKDLKKQDETRNQQSESGEESLEEDSEYTETAGHSRADKLKINTSNKEQNRGNKSAVKDIETSQKKKNRFSHKIYVSTAGGNRKTRTQTRQVKELQKNLGAVKI